MGRQAVHEQRIGLGGGEQLCRDRIGRHLPDALRLLVFLAHAHPDIGINHVGVFHRLIGIGRELIRIGREPLALELGFDLGAGRELSRTRKRDFHPEKIGAEDPRIRHVARGVAKKRDLPPAQRADEIVVLRPPLDHRERIRVDLAGVEKIGQGVDHRHRGPGGQPLDFRMVVGADNQTVDEAR